MAPWAAKTVYAYVGSQNSAGANGLESCHPSESFD